MNKELTAIIWFHNFTRAFKKSIDQMELLYIHNGRDVLILLMRLQMEQVMYAHLEWHVMLAAEARFILSWKVKQFGSPVEALRFNIRFGIFGRFSCRSVWFSSWPSRIPVGFGSIDVMDWARNSFRRIAAVSFTKERKRGPTMMHLLLHVGQYDDLFKFDKII